MWQSSLIGAGYSLRAAPPCYKGHHSSDCQALPWCFKPSGHPQAEKLLAEFLSAQCCCWIQGPGKVLGTLNSPMSMAWCIIPCSGTGQPGRKSEWGPDAVKGCRKKSNPIILSRDKAMLTRRKVENKDQVLHKDHSLRAHPDHSQFIPTTHLGTANTNSLYIFLQETILWKQIKTGEPWKCLVWRPQF